MMNDVAADVHLMMLSQQNDFIIISSTFLCAICVHAARLG